MTGAPDPDPGDDPYGNDDPDTDLYDTPDDYPEDPADDDPQPGPPAASAATHAADGVQPGLSYPTVIDFVAQHLAQVYARDLTDPAIHWCPRWWAHAEALDRLDACWRAWEHLRTDPTTGPSVWWREHADPAMRELLAASGPFSACTTGHQTKRPISQLPTEPPDPRLFPSGR